MGSHLHHNYGVHVKPENYKQSAATNRCTNVNYGGYVFNSHNYYKYMPFLFIIMGYAQITLIDKVW